ncbi:cellulase family glycosylhydrolase [Flammeovirgaceae bacterium SG7u.111]|nr:cellulase family glycosylhydrolase [Flammeovirgaceae bacterium SG7u.132]WPO37226.1 cellulase family glycosylhydrolase [Flammeovirgaceae bacterium SG7u.111]
MKMKMNFKYLFILILSLFLATLGFAQLPKISVDGNKLVKEDGTQIVFRGLNASDPGKLDKEGHWNLAYFQEAKKWGANIIRFPVHPVRWRSYGEEEYIKLLDKGVEWATEVGLHVIIDWHSIGNLRTGLYQADMYDTDLQETYRFWRAMARHYKGNTTIAFFELYNEPTLYHGELGTCTWEQWKGMMEEIIGIVRANGSEAIPLVAGFNWAYDLSVVKNNPIDAEGIAYVSHPYPQKREKPWEDKWTADWGFVAEKYPLILTEVGFCGPNERGAHQPVISDESYGDALVKYCDDRDISYLVWVFDPSWSPMMFYDWTFKPTPQGTYFKKVLQGYKY